MMCTLMPSAFCANVNEPRAADVNVTVPSAAMRHVWASPFGNPESKILTCQNFAKLSATVRSHMP